MGCSYFLPFAQGASDQFLASANFGTRRPAAEAGGQCTVLWLPCTPQLCSKFYPCDEVVVAGGDDGGALHGGAQLQRHEGGHLAGPAHQLQVLDCNLGFEYYLCRALLCTQWSQYSYFMRSNHFMIGSGDQ